METCAGIIIWRTRKGTDDVEMFMCTPGGPQWKRRVMWNFPKGHVENGESTFECAVREFTEETSIYPASINVNDYIYEGAIRQRSTKTVHVYSKEWAGETLDDSCKSNTFVENRIEYPEIEHYKWMTCAEIISEGGIKSYYTLFETIAARVAHKPGNVSNV